MVMISIGKPFDMRSSPSTKQRFNWMRPEYFAIGAFYVYLLLQDRVIGTWTQTLVVLFGSAVGIKLSFVVIRTICRFIRNIVLDRPAQSNQAMKMSIGLFLTIFALDLVCLSIALTYRHTLSPVVDTAMIAWLILTAPFAFGAFVSFWAEWNDQLFNDHR
ncbi:hypothetical protein BKI51_02510 [Alphaproteobacteria bacterium AO1-B]|nr:hypothetical protein BKI51_02510 [Alphaproteobacteria bacterium AO1-B]